MCSAGLHGPPDRSAIPLTTFGGPSWYAGVGCSRVYHHWQESNALRRRLYLGSTQPPACTRGTAPTSPAWCSVLYLLYKPPLCSGWWCAWWTAFLSEVLGPHALAGLSGDLARIEGKSVVGSLCSACPALKINAQITQQCEFFTL